MLHFRISARQIIGQLKLADSFGIELQVGDGLAAGAPLEYVANLELLFVDPISGAIYDAFFVP